MPCCGQCSSSSGCLVHRCLVGMSIINVGDSCRLQPNMRYLGIQDLRERFSQHICLRIPPCSFQKQSINICSIIWLLFQIVLLRITNNLKVKIYLINSHDVLSCIILLYTSHEGLSEEEAGNPEGCGGAFFYPFSHEVQTCNEVKDPRG